MFEELEIEELKKICVQILKRFNKICEENNLKYSIAFGTMIGAIRHKGFIPWDDDIDVMMPRDDYEKLLSLKYDDGEYEIKNYRYTKNYYYVFSKMIDKTTYLEENNRCEKNMGVFIDIFPFDYTDNDKKVIKRKVKKSTKYKKILDQIGNKTTKENSSNLITFIIKKVIRGMVKPFRKIILSYIDHKFIEEKKEYCNKFTYEGFEGKPIPTKYWDNIIEVEFENEKIKAIKDYDSYLREFYGDYMKFPPKEEQVSTHNFKAYRRKTN